jgi:hypothetical protein
MQRQKPPAPCAITRGATAGASSVAQQQQHAAMHDRHRITSPTNHIKQCPRGQESKRLSAREALIQESKHIVYGCCKTGWGCGYTEAYPTHSHPQSITHKQSGVRSEPSGVRSEPSGMRSELSGVRSEPSGMRLEPSGVRSKPSGVRLCDHAPSRRSGERTIGTVKDGLHRLRDRMSHPELALGRVLIHLVYSPCSSL